MARSTNEVSAGLFKELKTSMKATLTNESNYHVFLIAGLSLSTFIIFFALDIMHFPFGSKDPVSDFLTIGQTRHSVGVILALALIPLCAQKLRFAFLAAALLGAVISLLCIAHAINMIIVEPPLYRSQIHGPIIWTVTQLPIIYYGYKAFGRKEKNHG